MWSPSTSNQRKNKLTFIKIRKLMCQRTLWKEWKKSQEDGRKYLQIIHLLRVIFRLYKEVRQLNNKKIIWCFKWAKNVNSIPQKKINKEQAQERCSTSFVFSEIQIKTTVRCHFTPTRMASMKKRQAITSFGKNMEKLEHLHIAGENVKW